MAEAQAEGIFDLDCGADGIIGPGYFDPAMPDDVTLCTAGFPSMSSVVQSYSRLLVRRRNRTMAEAYSADHNSYQYWGEAG